MPFDSNESLPKGVKSLSPDQQTKWRKVFNSAYDGTCANRDDRDECASKIAWSQVKKAELEEFSLTIKKAVFDEPTQEMRWRADTSDIDDDSYGDNMTLELFEDFVDRINKGELAPEPFRSDFWQGGMPYLSVSHYPDMNGKAVPGSVDNVYMDGKFLKATGKFSDTPLGRACFKSACKSVHSKEDEDKVRISIAFLDWMHKHKSNNYVFERKDLSDFCPECLKELINGDYKGRTFIKGQLVHLAQTKVPVNKRTEITAEVDRAMAKTRKEDAASIVGEELAEQLEEEAKLVGKSEALVIKADEVIVEETEHGKDMPPNKHAEDEEYPDCKDEKTGEMDADCVKMHKEKKSEAVETKAEVIVEPAPDWNKLYNMMLDIKSMVTPKDLPVHPLDAAIQKLKADYDATIAMEIIVDEKLQLLQPALNEFAQVMVGTIKSSVPENKSEAKEDSEVMKVLAMMAQKMELLSTQVQQLQQQPVVVNPLTPVVPRSRAIDPAQVQQSIATGVAKSTTPKLRALIEQTT